LVDKSYENGPVRPENQREHWSPDLHDDESSVPQTRDDVPEYLPGAGKARATIILLLLWIVTAVVMIFSAQLQISVLQREKIGQMIQPNEAEVVEAIDGLAGLLNLVVRVALIIAFCLWIYQAHKNLTLLGTRGLTYTPGWAVGWFFIPIMQLFRPYQVTQELWKASSQLEPLRDPFAWQRNSGSGLILAWWLLWVLGDVLNGFVFRAFWKQNPSPDELASALYVTCVADGVHILAAVLAIFVVNAIVRRQTETHEMLLGRGDERDYRLAE
jgi:hypothetical protein